MSELGKLRWRCRRGMKELDHLLLRYLEQCYPAAPEQERIVFAQLLELQDPQLFRYLTGRDIGSISDPLLSAVIRKIAAVNR
jgi:antitoxin CptB